jgi:hypothetical protein
MNWLSNTIARSGICAVSGAIAGAIVGYFFGLPYALAGSPHVPAVSWLWWVALGLSVFAWLVLLVIVGIFGNYGVVRIAVWALGTSLVTGILTVWAIYVLHIGFFGALLGWLIGFFVGKSFCAMCAAYQNRGTS